MIQLPQHRDVVLHPECHAELTRLIHEGERPAFIADYQSRISFLAQHFGQEARLHPSWYEVLKSAEGLRSIRFLKFRNLRILYILDNGTAFLLLAFEEKQGHRRTEYSRYIDPALKRFKEGKK